MKTLLAAASLSLLLGAFGALQAAPIPGLYNTGVDDFHALLADGAADSHYDDLGWVALAPASLPGTWISNASSPASRWISPAAHPTADNADTLRVLTLEFTIGPALDPSTASLGGRWAADNLGDIYLNGGAVSLGHSPAGGGNLGFIDWSPFSASAGFVSGVNTLEFHVTNFGQGGVNPTGLRVEFLQSSIAAIPEPGTYALLLAGLGLLGFALRRKGRGTE